MREGERERGGGGGRGDRGKRGKRERERGKGRAVERKCFLLLLFYTQ